MPGRDPGIQRHAKQRLIFVYPTHARAACGAVVTHRDKLVLAGGLDDICRRSGAL